MSKSDMEKRYDSETAIGMWKHVTIKNMVCKDCVHAYENVQMTAKCDEYPDMKPGKVIYGKDCEKFKSKNK